MDNRTDKISGMATPAAVVERGRHDHNQHVAAILILTVLIQVILVKSWT